MPKISVIVPIYNVEAFLEECLESVLCQDFTDMEIICVNDGSTDASLDILHEVEKKSSKIKVFSKENGGLSSARNYGINKATGQYLYFLDSDDRLADTHCLSFMVEQMEKEELDILYFDGKSFFQTEEIHQNNKFYDNAYKRKKDYGVYYSGQQLFVDMVLEGDYYVPVWLQCYRADYLKKIDLWFENGLLYEDNIFTFISILSAGKVAHYKKTVLDRRIREDSIMQKKLKAVNVYSRLFTYKKMLAHWGVNIFPEETQKAIEIVVNGMQSGTLNMYMKLEEIEQEKVKSLEGMEKYLLNSLVRSLGKIVDDTHVFPYQLFSKGDRVLIYGAGKIGKSFYSRAMSENVVEITGIVDKRALEMTEEEVPVLPVAMIQQLEYDYILISVENKEIANSIKNDLIQMGVLEKQIKWDGAVYVKRNYQKAFNEYCKWYNRNVTNLQPKFYLFMLPEHGNLGDYAIGYAEEKFFKQYFPMHDLVTVTTEEWKELQSHFIKSINCDDVIFITGGGFFGDMWTSGEICKQIVEAFPANKKIFLPNNLTYTNGISTDNITLQKDVEWLNSQLLTYMFLREEKSYQYLKNKVKNVYLATDMVLSMRFANEQKENNGKLLLCLRNDKEKLFSKEQELKECLEKNGYSWDETDIHLMRYVRYEKGREQLEAIINQIQKYALVITDRLHGMILSTISEVPCICFDNTTKKISGVFATMKTSKHTKVITEKEVSNLPELISELSKTEGLKYEVPTKRFDEIANTIRGIIEDSPSN